MLLHFGRFEKKTHKTQWKTQKLFGKRQLKSFCICCFRFVIFQRMRKKTGAPAFNHLSGCPLFPAFQESLTSLLAFGFLVIYFCNLFRGFLSYGTFAWVISFVGLQEAFFLQMGAPEVCRGVASRPCYLHSTIHNNIAIQNYSQYMSKFTHI